MDDKTIDWSNPIAWDISAEDREISYVNGVPTPSVPFHTIVNARKQLIQSAFRTFPEHRDLIDSLLTLNNQLDWRMGYGAVINLSLSLCELQLSAAKRLEAGRVALPIDQYLKDQLKDELGEIFDKAFDRASRHHGYSMAMCDMKRRYYEIAMRIWSAAHCIQVAKHQLGHGIEQRSQPQASMVYLLHDGVAIGSSYDHSGVSIAIPLSFYKSQTCDLESLFAPNATVSMQCVSPMVRLRSGDVVDLLLTSPEISDLCVFEVDKPYRKSHFDVGDSTLESFALLIDGWGMVHKTTYRDNVCYVSLV